MIKLMLKHSHRLEASLSRNQARRTNRQLNVSSGLVLGASVFLNVGLQRRGENQCRAAYSEEILCFPLFGATVWEIARGDVEHMEEEWK
jgi:hypothetical protein